MHRSDSAQRLNTIDEFRGLAILLMALANYFYGVQTVPSWLHHAVGIGYTPSDLVAPLFLFAIGLTYGISFQRRRERSGTRAAAEHMVVRYLAIAGLGLLISSIQRALGFGEGINGWGVLQAIGTAGLISLPFIALQPWARLLIALSLLALYQGLLEHGWMDAVLKGSHGDLYGAISWGAMLLAATALGDLYHDAPKGRRLVPWLSLALLAAGVALAPWAPVSKDRVSATYALVSLGASGLIFMALHFLDARLKPRLPTLAACGRNPLLLYVLHLMLLGVFYFPSSPWWYAQAPIWLAILQAVAFLILLGAIGRWLDRKGWHVSL